jgi:hypothetical protein
MRVCAITNVFDESFNLPIWIRYYGRELGRENCVIVDHGSDSLSPEAAGCSVIHTPRSVFDDAGRARMISHLVSAMLEHYDAVLYTDCDEFLVPDPAIYSGLKQYLAGSDRRAWTAIGFDVVHNLAEEEALDPSRPVLDQRSHVVFNPWLCKTLITRDSIRWGGGFHASSAPPAFDDLYLFHIRAVDLGESLKRLAKTRRVSAIHADMGAHHRWKDMTLIQKVVDFTTWEQKPDLAELPHLLERVLASVERSEGGLYNITERFRPGYAMRLPERFQGLF